MPRRNPVLSDDLERRKASLQGSSAVIIGLMGNRKVWREARHLPPMNSVERRTIAVLVWLILVMFARELKLLESRVVDLKNIEERDLSVLGAHFRALPGVHEVILLPGENFAYLKVDPERFHNESLSNMAGIEIKVITNFGLCR